MAATTFKTRKALGRRYGTDPALLLEMERLNQQYQLAPGREARGMQAAQYAESMAFNREQAEQNRKDREEANRQASKSGMIGTTTNLATTGLTLRALTKGKDAKFFGDWSGTPKTPPSQSVTGLEAGTTEFYTGTGATPPTGAPTSGAPPTNLTVTPATTDIIGTGLGTATEAEAGGIAASYAAEDAAAGTALTAGETGGTVGGSVGGGIVGGVGRAALGYAAAKGAGAIISNTFTKPMSTLTGQGYMHTMGKSLNQPFNVERTWGQALGLEDDDSTTINIIHDIINPLGWAERQIDTVICTELNIQGVVTDRELKLTSLYSRKHLPEKVHTGYLVWAIPTVRLMRKNKLFNLMFKPIALSFVNQCVNIVKGKRGTFIQRVTHKAAYGLSLSMYFLKAFRVRLEEVAHG